MGCRRNTVIEQTSPLHLPPPATPRVEQLWKNIYRADAYRRQGGKCCYCREPMTRETVSADHVVARRNGGITSRENIKAACKDCNAAKGHMTEKKFKALLRCPGDGASLGLLMAVFRFRLWTRVELAETRLFRAVGIEVKS